MDFLILSMQTGCGQTEYPVIWCRKGLCLEEMWILLSKPLPKSEDILEYGMSLSVFSIYYEPFLANGVIPLLNQCYDFLLRNDQWFVGPQRRVGL